MYLLAQAALPIECPRQLAFDYAANLENFPAWFPGVLRVTAANDLAFESVGKLYREHVNLPLRGQRSVVLRVVEVTPTARIVTEGTLPTLLPRMEIEFRETGAASCVVDWRMFSRTTSRLGRWVILPLARRLMTRRAQAGLRCLKRHLESNPPAQGLTTLRGD